MATQVPALESAIPALERLDILIAATNAAQISSLRIALPKLEQLEKVLAADRADQLTSFSKFEANESL